MLRILYYRDTYNRAISAKKGGGLILHHGRIIRILRYVLNKEQCSTTTVYGTTVKSG